MTYLEGYDAKRRKADPEYAACRAVSGFIIQLTEERKSRGLTQTEVAELAGIPQSHVSKIERLESDRVALDTLLRYANAIGMSFKLVHSKRAHRKAS